jgi:hypothetical protein
MDCFRETQGEVTMFTVVRFSSEFSLLPTLMELGSEMNGVRPGVFSGVRKAGDGFACDISSSDSWQDHAREVIRFVEEFRDIISRALSAGARVNFDVAVEPEDRGLRSVFLDHSLLNTLVGAQVTFEVSFYPS